MKEITVYQINEIMDFKFNIFDEEDNDYPDYRKVRIWERAIDRLLKCYDKKDMYDIYSSIYWSNSTTENAKSLESKGFKIIRDKREQYNFLINNNLRKNLNWKFD